MLVPEAGALLAQMEMETQVVTPSLVLGETLLL
jgi:hypothetical protein